ncbi:hypothetical protein KP509_17G018400 [Ceratopteris richardii]|nr:hypothetical protein KP509_17G018400 [Ceratopteris richardii]
MGLETMPCPVILRCERNQSEETLSPVTVHCGRNESEEYRNVDCLLSRDGLQLEKQFLTEKGVQQSHRSSCDDKQRQFKREPHVMLATHQKGRIKHASGKSKYVWKSSLIPPHHVDSTFPPISSSKSGCFHKCASSSKNTAHMIDATPKMLKSNVQPTYQTKSQYQRVISRPKFGSLDASRKGRMQKVPVHLKSQNTIARGQPPHGKKDQKGTAQVSVVEGDNQMVKRWGIPDRQSYCLHKATQSKISRKKTLEQPNCYVSQNPNWKRQRKTCSTVSQPTICSALKAQQRSRDLSPANPVQDTSDDFGSKSSNYVSSSFKCSLASPLPKSQVSADEFSSSSELELHQRPQYVDGCMHTILPWHPTCSKQDKLPCRNLGMLQKSDTYQFDSCETSLRSQYDSNSLSIYTDSPQSSMESFTSSEPSEFPCSSEESFDHLTQKCMSEAATEQEKMEADGKSHDFKKPMNLMDCQSSSEGNSGSLSESLGHTALCSKLNAGTKSFVSGSTSYRRNTAMILQELLTALNSSRSRKTLNDVKPEGAGSGFTESDFTTTEKVHVFLTDCVQHNEDPSLEPTLETSGICNSIDYSQILHGAYGHEVRGSFRSTDLSGNVKTHAEDEYLGEVMSKETEANHEQSWEHVHTVDCESLMETIMRLHQIDPETIGIGHMTQKQIDDELILVSAYNDSRSRSCIDSILSVEKNGEEVLQLDGVLSDVCMLTTEEDFKSIYRSGFESSFRYYEAGKWNKNLITDCINEALKSFSRKFYWLSVSFPGQSSVAHVLSRTYKQLDEWTEMAATMDLDEMVEKEMHLSIRNWKNIELQTEEVAEILETAIYDELLEELLFDLLRMHLESWH